MKILEHILAALVGLGMIAAGGAKLASVEQLVQNFERWGYPSWFLYVTGVIEVVAGIAIIAPKTRLVGAALIVVTMLGATATHLRAGEGFAEAIPAIAHLGIAAVVGALALRRRRA